MRAWPGPDVPRLPGTGDLPRVFDTASGALRQVGGHDAARMYVCGITPYDATHLGHAATYLAFDLLGRLWRDAGADVTYAQNVTDVDDPLLERATATGVDWEQLAERETDLFRADMSALRVLPPDHYIGAVEAIPLVADAIRDLAARDSLYDVDADRYFRAAAAPGFGGVSHLDRAAMLDLFAERGGDPARRGKADPLDCLVWQAERPGEPSWEAGLGKPGRPGWHIECTAIAREYLGAEFDVQGGGRDLVFPHHEMCAAQATTLGDPLARAYVHTGMVGLDGEKMSKSKGNLVLVSQLRAAGVDPMAIRVALLAHHYRGDWEWTDADLTGATARLAAWRSALDRGTTHAAAEQLLRDVRAALAADLDAPRALRAVDAWAAAPTAPDPTDGRPLVADTLDALLGVSLLEV